MLAFTIHRNDTHKATTWRQMANFSSLLGISMNYLAHKFSIIKVFHTTIYFSMGSLDDDERLSQLMHAYGSPCMSKMRSL